MTTSPKDLNTFSSSPAPAAALLGAEADPIAAVLDRHGVDRPPAGSPPARAGTDEHGGRPEAASGPDLHDQAQENSGIGAATQMPRRAVLDIMHRAGYTPAQIQEVHALLPEQVDSHEDHVVLEKYGLNTAARMERQGSSP